MELSMILKMGIVAFLGCGLGYFFARFRASKSEQSMGLELAKLEAALGFFEQEIENQKTMIARHESEADTSLERINALSEELATQREQSSRATVETQQIQKQLDESKREKNEALVRCENLGESLRETESKLDKVTASFDEKEASFAREIARFEEQKEALKLQFKELSAEILATNSKALQEANQQSLSATINPFKDSIDAFKKTVHDNHRHENEQRAALRQELETLKELNLKITTEAHELSTALRGQKKLQGNWGELVLENVLERSGLELGKDYQREVSFNTEEGRLRPDAVVYLPQGKHLIVDAKVSLNAYTRYVNSEDESERAIALNEHVGAMRDRIKELADKDYYKLPGMNSPEIVFMFVPIESAFVEALKADEQLFQEAIANNVLVATPTTLLTSLNIVRQLWRYEDQNKHTAELAKKADGVFKKLNGFLVSFEGVKKGLDRAQESYAKAEGQLLSGKGNLVKQVGDFKKLAPAIKAELPEYFSDKADLEIDFVPSDEQIEEASAKQGSLSIELDS